MGAFEEAKGKLKQAAGDVVNDPDLRREGEAQEDKGEAEREATQARAEARTHETRARVEEERQEAAEDSK